MEVLLIFLLIFAIGTLILAKFTKLERHFIVFLVRTKFFLNLIEKIAKLAPGLWKFLADLAIIFSFAGLGAAYLSKHRKESRNLDIILIGVGSLFILPLALSGKPITFLLFIPLILVTRLLHKIKNQKLDFIVFSLIISLGWLKFFSGLMIGLLGEISNPLVLNFVALVGGIFGIPGLVILSFLYQGYLIIFQNLNVPGVSPFLPATKEGEIGMAAPGTGIFIPLWCFLIAIIVTIIPHEFSHGILARVHNLKLKSTGLLLLGIIPVGAFVEPDEKEFKKRKGLEKMRILAVGSFSNFIVATIFFGLLLVSPLVMSPYLSDGILIIETQEGYPAFDVLSRDDVIYEINSQPTRNLDEFKEVMLEIEPREKIWLKTNKGEINLTAVESPHDPKGAYLGIILIPHLPGFIQQLLFWIFFINFSIALVNLLPIIPLDGGKMLEELVGSFNLKEKIKKKVIYLVVTFILGLVVINMLPLLNMLAEFLAALL